LYRYSTAPDYVVYTDLIQTAKRPYLMVGLYKVENSVDPELESTRFQPLNLKCHLLVSKFAFTVDP
jgi:hypothetical protein